MYACDYDISFVFQDQKKSYPDDDDDPLQINANFWAFWYHISGKSL